MGVLDGRGVVVTGAGRGLGAAFARSAALEGASIIVNDVNPAWAEATAKSIRDVGGRALAHPADISSWSAAEELIGRCVDEFGSLDGLVNNAALDAVGAPEEVTEDDIRRVVNVNVLGTMFCGTHAFRRMVGRGHGSIVNITSGAQSGLVRHCVYGASKGAVASLTYSWALEMGDRGIRINAFSPMATSQLGRDAEELYRQQWGREPAGMLEWSELPGPDVNAPVVTFLLSDLSGAVNGQVLRLDHGQLSLMTHPGVVYPPLQREEWTLDDIAAAFDGDLRTCLQPLGIRAFEVTERAVPKHRKEPGVHTGSERIARN